MNIPSLRCPSGGASSRLLRSLLLLVCFALSTAWATAQDAQATGTVTGRVLNAANGRYLPNARVVVEGTNIETFTNDFGEYTLRNVPAGQASVRANFTGQDPVSATVTVPAGGSVQQSFRFGREGTSDDEGIALDPFEVEANRFRTASEIAINEERYSVNIKNVVSTDAFGEIPGGNVGEFLKFLPGIELEYGGTYTAPTDASGISVRGFGPEDTAIYIDGVPVASASQGSLTNQVGLDMLAINNASRIELIKVPTPDMPMNSVGGQVNLISKSAFEYAQPRFNVSAYITVNSEEPNPFKKVAGPEPKKVYAGSPGFNLSYIKPVNEKFGFTITASSFSQYSANRRFRPEWGTSNVRLDLRPFGGANNTNITNDEGVVSLANPYMTRISITDAPRTNTGNSLSLKGDWKPIDGLALTGSYQVSTYESRDAARRIQIRTQRPMSWGADHTISFPYLQASQSATGSAFNPSNSLDMNIDSRDKEGITHTGYLRAIYQRGPWDIFALASASTSRASFKDFENGHFSTVDVSASIGQVKFEDIKDGIPGSVTVYDRNGNVFDYTKLSNWSAPEIRGRSGKAESLDDVFNYKLDVRRELDFLPWDNFRMAVKAGFLREETLKKKWGRGTNYRESYVGPELDSDDYLDTTYIGQDPGFGFPAQEWISTYRLYDIFEENPNNFVVTEADARENWFSYVGQNKNLKETKDSWYAMIDGTTLRNRLSFVAGLRQETTTRVGRTPQIDGRWNYIKNADGTLYRNIGLLGGVGTVRIDQANSPLFAQNALGTALRSDLSTKGIEFPTAVVANNSLEGAMRQRRALQPVYGKSEGKPSYSINLAYEFTKKLVGKVAYSRTFGRIPIEDATRGILTAGNSFNITQQEDPTAIPAGRITVANPNLLPEIANNWDFALTYYTESGGKFGASYYFKDIENFSDTFVTTSGSPDFNAMLATLGLDPEQYQNWEIATSLNGLGTGKVSGYELEMAQDLRGIRWFGDWGRRFYVFATYTHSKREEDNTTRISARPAASQLATAGINFTTGRLSVFLKGTWRDLTFVTGRGNFTIDGVTYQLGEYTPSFTKLDLSADYKLSERYSLFLTARDILNTGSRTERFDLGGIYPPYAHWDDIREFGVQVTIGVRGQF